MLLALLAMSVGTFAIGTTEFVTMGLLPNIASGVSISVPEAGHLVSAYATGVVIGAPVIAVLGTRLPRKTMLLVTMVVFAAGNLASGLMPGYWSLLLARVVSGLPHGAFFSTASIVAADLSVGDSGRTNRAKAVSMVFLGFTLANVAGVPLGTLIGQWVGWRWTFAVVGLIGVVSVLLISVLVPAQQRTTSNGGVLHEFKVFKRPQVWLSLAIVMFGLGGIFACFSYITPMMTGAAGFGPSAMSWLLAIFGVGMTIGNLAGGRLADRALMPSLYVGLGGLAVTLGLFFYTAYSSWLAVGTMFLIGITGFSIGPVVQTLIMYKAAGAPGLASASIHSAFNIANAAGAYLGGLSLSVGLGLTSPNLMGAGLACVGLALALISGRLDVRAARGRSDKELATM